MRILLRILPVTPFSFLNIAILDTLLHVVGDDAEGILVGQIADDILNVKAFLLF